MNKSKNHQWESTTGANRSVPRNSDSTSITTMYSESGPTYRPLSRTCWNSVQDCRVRWKTGRRLQIIPAGLPRDQLPILLTLAVSERRGIRVDSTGLGTTDKRWTNQEAMLRSTDYLRRIISPAGGQRGVTMSYLCPHGNSFPMDDHVWWVSAEKEHTNWWCAICGEKYDWRAPNRLLVVQKGESVN